MTLNNGFGKCSLFDLRSKHGLFVFPPKETLISRRHCSIGKSCCSMTSKRSISWTLESSSSHLGYEVFSPERSLNQPKATHVCICSINQISLFPFVRCFCFLCAFSFQGHMKIGLSLNEVHSIFIQHSFSKRKGRSLDTGPLLKYCHS